MENSIVDETNLEKNELMNHLDVNLDVNSILERLKFELILKTNSDLARVMNIPISTVNSWKHRNSIDIKTVINFCNEKSLDPNWILFGYDRFQYYDIEEVDNSSPVPLSDERTEGRLRRSYDNYRKQVEISTISTFLDSFPNDCKAFLDKKFEELDNNFTKFLLMRAKNLEQKKVELESKLDYANTLIEKLISK